MWTDAAAPKSGTLTSRSAWMRTKLLQTSQGMELIFYTSLIVIVHVENLKFNTFLFLPIMVHFISYTIMYLVGVWWNL